MKCMLVGIFALLSTALWATAPKYIECVKDPHRQPQRAAELQALVKADQEDRKTQNIDWNQVSPRDEQRRKRVGEIFGEGCLLTAQDFAAAALIFQHGTSSDHYYQAFLWSKRAVELGDLLKKHDMGNGIDRYLVSIGHKQLYATQAGINSKDGCHCLKPVEPSFPDQKRNADMDWSMDKGLAMTAMFNKGTTCDAPQICEIELRPTPKGSVPGVW